VIGHPSTAQLEASRGRGWGRNQVRVLSGTTTHQKVLLIVLRFLGQALKPNSFDSTSGPSGRYIGRTIEPNIGKSDWCPL
jgi:hypothetical protein